MAPAAVIVKQVKHAASFKRSFTQKAVMLGPAIIFELIANASLSAFEGSRVYWQRAWPSARIAQTRRQNVARSCAESPLKLSDLQSPKEKMFDQSGQWKNLETVDDFDNGLSELIDLWSSTSKTVTKAVKAAALAHFKEDLDAAMLTWIDNRAKSKKYAAIAQELAEFEEALEEAASVAPVANKSAPDVPAKAKTKA